MKDAEFIVDGTLTEEYIIGIIKELKWNFATKEESDGSNINVLDHNGNFLGTIYLTMIKQNDEVSYGEDSLQIKNALKIVSLK
jgi:hypothetical protein